ncbi:MAG: hypothetical protein OEY14_03800 [Myxococcales bacterium]|nr:hypothetical protein [Myxococcales bacterium]
MRRDRREARKRGERKERRRARRARRLPPLRRADRGSSQALVGRPPIHEAGIAERGYERYVLPDRPPPELWISTVEAFLLDEGVARAEEAGAVLLCALAGAPSEERFLEAGWIDVSTVEVYTRYDGPGFRSRGVVALLDRFILWLHEHRDLPRWDTDRLLYALDRHRGAIGAPPRGRPEAFDLCIPPHELDALVASFATQAPGLPPFLAHMAVATLPFLAHFARLGGIELLRFGAVDVDQYLLEVHAASRPLDPEHPITEQESEEMIATSLQVTVHFYSWLAATRRLSGDRAREILHGLSRIRSMRASA